MNYAEEIKIRVKMPELVRFCGLNPNRQNRVACPFHGGKNPNLGIKEDFCHCFKCGYKADVIKFVQDYFGLSFQAALVKINDDFSLGIPIGEKVDKRRAIDDAKKRYIERNEINGQRDRLEGLQNNFYNAVGEFARLEKNRLKHAPRVGEEFHPLFVEALKNTDNARYNIFCAEEDLKNEIAKSSCGSARVYGE